MLTASILTQQIIFVFISSFIYIFIYLFIFIYIYHIYNPLCSLYTSTFSMKIISSAPCLVALVHHPAGAGVPETGSRLRSGHRPINTRTGSPVPAT